MQGVDVHINAFTQDGLGLVSPFLGQMLVASLSLHRRDVRAFAGAGREAVKPVEQPRSYCQ